MLGFSKGPTQAGALKQTAHDQVAFKGGRANLAKILHHIGQIERPDAAIVDRLIGNPSGRVHFGSLIRCTVERKDGEEWVGTGGGMLDRFLQTAFGRDVAGSCVQQHLGSLPSTTRLIVMLGMGSKGNYVHACRRLFELRRPGSWIQVNDVTYADDQVVVVHTEHFASQGALIPNWLSGERHPRGRLGLLAREGVAFAAARAGRHAQIVQVLGN